MAAQMRILILLVLFFAVAPLTGFSPAEAAGMRMDENGAP
jgi:hypothetical protein